MTAVRQACVAVQVQRAHQPLPPRVGAQPIEHRLTFHREQVGAPLLEQAFQERQDDLVVAEGRRQPRDAERLGAFGTEFTQNPGRRAHISPLALQDSQCGPDVRVPGAAFQRIPQRPLRPFEVSQVQVRQPLVGVEHP